MICEAATKRTTSREDALADARVLPPGFPATLTIAASLAAHVSSVVVGRITSVMCAGSRVRSGSTRTTVPAHSSLDVTAASPTVCSRLGVHAARVVSWFAMRRRTGAYSAVLPGRRSPAHPYDELVDRPWRPVRRRGSRRGRCSDTGPVHDTAVALPSRRATCTGVASPIHGLGHRRQCRRRLPAQLLGAETLPLVVFGDDRLHRPAAACELRSILCDDAQQRAIFAHVPDDRHDRMTIQPSFDRNLNAATVPARLLVPATWSATQARAIGQRHLGMPPPR